ncbi:MAG: phenylacetate--CoA ligase family protein [Phycisphaerae bacterium]|nr:phenylacetate--CoA ligase family protein [Phycisphaerae bacterium]
MGEPWFGLMKRALSRKNLWDAIPRPLKATLGLAAGLLPLAYVLGGRFRRALQFVRRADRWSAEESRAYQLQQLRRMCELAYEQTPFYRRVFDEHGFDPHGMKRPEDLRALPTIDKDVVRRHVGEMCAVSPNSPGVDFVSTGGTGGEPLHFYIGSDRSAVEYAHLVAGWERAGFRLGSPMAVFRGRVVDERRTRLRHDYDPLLRCHYYSNFHMTDMDMRRYLAHLRGIGPCFLHVYPSSVANLARFLVRSGLTPPTNIDGIIAESEIVYPDQRQLVEQVFKCRYFSCYGHSEKLVAAAECEHSADYHVWPTYGYFELLDDNGRPVTTPGQRGEIAGTGFINTVMPFIRYRTGDYATYVGDHCEACGRAHTVITDIRGHRTQEFLIASDGSEISWTALNMHDDTFTRVQQFQFHQDTPGRAVLRLVPAEGFGDENRQRIDRNLGRKFAGRLDFAIELVDGITLSASGKAIYIDQRITSTDVPGAAFGHGQRNLSGTGQCSNS